MARESIQLVAGEGIAYVSASAEFLPPETTAEDYAAQYEEQLRSALPAYEQLGVETVPLPRGRAVVRKFRWTPPDGDPVTELQMYTVHDGRGIVSTAGAPATAFE